MTLARALTVLFVASLAVPVMAETLYWTDFDNFPAGENQWQGTDGWVSNASTGGVQSIDSEAIPGGGLGQTASIGFNRPPTTFSTVFRNMDFDPSAKADALVIVEVLLGIQDSTNNFRDSFFVSIYNRAGEFLASIRFSNEDETFGVWRGDSNDETDTDIPFIRGELHLLTLRIDAAANVWSADLDDLPLFRAEIFCARTERERTFGPLAFEWQLSQNATALYGNNWMLVADVRIETDAEGLPITPTEPFGVTSISHDADGKPVLHWPAEAGFSYTIEQSTDCQIWSPGLPAPLTATETGPMMFVDEAADVANPGVRYYRVIRSSAAAALNQ